MVGGGIIEIIYIVTIALGALVVVEIGVILSLLSHIQKLEKSKGKAEKAPAKAEKEAPTPKLKPAQIESAVYGYIVTHGGEINIDECTEELEISKDDVRVAIKALKATGKLKKG